MKCDKAYCKCCLGSFDQHFILPGFAMQCRMTEYPILMKNLYPLMLIILNSLHTWLSLPLMMGIVFLGTIIKTYFTHRGDVETLLGPFPYPKSLSLHNLIQYYQDKGVPYIVAYLLANLVGTLIWFPISIVYGSLVCIIFVVITTPFLLCLTIIYLGRVALNLAALY